MATVLESGAGSQIVIRRLIEAPRSGVVCVAVAHQRKLINTTKTDFANVTSEDASAANATTESFYLPELQVNNTLFSFNTFTSNAPLLAFRIESVNTFMFLLVYSTKRD